MLRASHGYRRRSARKGPVRSHQTERCLVGDAAHHLRRVHLIRGYTTWALFQGEYYWFGNYLSPFYSPELFGDSPHAVFGPWRWPWLPFFRSRRRC